MEARAYRPPLGVYKALMEGSPSPFTYYYSVTTIVYPAL